MKMTDNKKYVEEVCDWAKNYNYCPQLLVKFDASFAFINQQGVTEQRIQWGSNHTQHDKYFIPQMKKQWVFINNTFKISQTFTLNFLIKSYVSKTRKPIKTSSKACWNWSQCSQRTPWVCFSGRRKFAFTVLQMETFWTPEQGTANGTDKPTDTSTIWFWRKESHEMGDMGRISTAHRSTSKMVA